MNQLKNTPRINLPNMPLFNMALNTGIINRNFSSMENNSYQETFYAKDLIFTERKELI